VRQRAISSFPICSRCTSSAHREAQRAGARVRSRENEVIADTAAAVRLNGPVDDAACHRRSGDFDHRDLFLGGAIADGIHHVGSIQHQPARWSMRILDSAIRSSVTPRSARRVRTPPLRGTPAEQFERAFGNADQRMQ